MYDDRMTDDRIMPGFDEDDAATIEDIIEPKRSAPVFIDDLPDAVVDGKLMCKEGDLIVVEKWLTIGSKPRWLGTSLCRVKRIDPLGSGDLTLHDEELQQSAHANYVTGPKHGWRFKLGAPGLNLLGRSRQGRALCALNELAEEIGQLPVSMLAVGSEGPPDRPTSQGNGRSGPPRKKRSGHEGDRSMSARSARRRGSTR